MGYLQLQKPCGLVIDKDNNLLVTDRDACLICKFTFDGRHVGRSSKLEYSPRYIAELDGGNFICTADWGIRVFK